MNRALNKTPLTYYGGKQTMSRHILPLIPPHGLYCEPFVGGGSIFRLKKPSQIEVLNDSNVNLVNFYEIVQDRLPELLKRVNRTLHSRHHYEKAILVNANPTHESPVRRARAVRVLFNQGFAGNKDCRSYGRKGNSSGRDATTQKNMSKRRQLGVQDENGTYLMAQRLENVQLECADALKVIRNRDCERAFFYIDPPYMNADQGPYAGYTPEDYEKLLQTLTTLKGKFLLSCYDDPLIRQYAHYHSRTVEKFVKPLSAQKVAVGAKRKTKTELLVRNYQLPMTNDP